MEKMYFNGKIVTVNDQQPLAEALLIEDGRIKAVGDLQTVAAMASAEAERIDLEGKAVLPGFIDGHSHIGMVTAGMPTVYPSPAGSINSIEDLKEELKRLVEKNAILDNGWLVALGYDNGFYENEAHPSRADLDEASTDIPILVLHASGHVGVVNSKALEIMGWNKDTLNPEGGVIRKDPETGEPNGLLEEKAVMAVSFMKALVISQETAMELFMKAQNYYVSFGITTAQDGATTPPIFSLLEEARDRERMFLDVVCYPMQEMNPENIEDHSAKAQYHHHLKIGGSKVVADGSPQAKTAWLTQPYYRVPEFEAPDYRGYPVYTDEQMVAYCKQCIEHEWQLLVHCNGDAMSDQYIRTYKKAKEELGSTADLRPVMIHAQTVREDQLDEMKKLGMMPSFFHDHTFYWGDYHLDSVLGPERGRRISPLKSAVDRDMKFTIHNDYAVTPPNMIFAIHNAVNRKTRAGRDIGPEFAIDVMEAIRSVTIYGAYQYFDEALKGSLEVGKLADLVILDQSPLDVPKDKIKDIQVLETIKEGTTIYKRA